jgi:hypothetical protein
VPSVRRRGNVTTRLVEEGAPEIERWWVAPRRIACRVGSESKSVTGRPQSMWTKWRSEMYACVVEGWKFRAAMHQTAKA